MENSLKPPQDIYKASLKSTTHLDQQFQISLVSDKTTLLRYIQDVNGKRLLKLTVKTYLFNE